MFHEFREAYTPQLDAVCRYICRHFEPVSLASIIAAMNGRAPLPANALAVTVDDGYRNFLLNGHPIFRRHRIPTTIYVVAGFADRRLWLWTDQIAFGLKHTTKGVLPVEIDGKERLELDLSTPELKTRAAWDLCQILKRLPNARRLQFMERFGAFCGVELPPEPPAERLPLSWDELRGLAAEEVEIGCHTYSHPILSRVTDPAELHREIQGAKEVIETHLKSQIHNFCYPNGREIDISDQAADAVRSAGFDSSVTCTWGLNKLAVNPFRIKRLPLNDDLSVEYAAELLVGLHYSSFAR